MLGDKYGGQVIAQNVQFWPASPGSHLSARNEAERRDCVPISRWAPDSQRGWSVVIGVRQVDGNDVLLKAVGLDEFLLCRCPGGECQ